MPMNGKQILITTESHEVFVIRRNEPAETFFCPNCGDQLVTTGFEPASQAHSTYNSEDLVDVRRMTDELEIEE